MGLAKKLKREWTRPLWTKQTPNKQQRTYLATKSPLAWIFEYGPQIKQPGKGWVKFSEVITYAQQDLIYNFDTQFRILEKSRQSGFTTAFAVEACWKFIHKPLCQIVVISKNEKDALRFIAKFYETYDSVKDRDPNCPELAKRNSGYALSVDGRELYVLTSSKGAGRGFTPTDIYLDELAWQTYGTEIYDSLLPGTETTDGTMTLFSTPNGRGNIYEEIATNAEDMDYAHFQYEWWFFPPANPYYKEMMAAYLAGDRYERFITMARKADWYLKKMKRYRGRMGAFLQEYECDFGAGGKNVFSSKALNQVFVKNYLPECDTSEFAEVFYRDKFDEKHEYIMTADLGRKNDPTVIGVFDITSARAKLVEIKIVEGNMIGWGDILKEMEETYLYWGKPECYHDATGSGDAITSLIETNEDVEIDSVPIMLTGNSAGTGTKYQYIETCKAAAEGAAFVLPRIKRLYNEFKSYRWEDKKLVQDCVIMVALATKVFFNDSNEFVGHRDLNYVGGYQNGE